jgi:hypothetical protein
MRYGSRKLLMTLIGIALAGALAYIDKLSPAAATLIGSLVSGYLASNVTQKAVTSAPE